MADEFIEWLHRGPLPREVVGGKASSLATLMAAGFSVPAGFAVTASAYRHFEDEAGIASELHRLTERLVAADRAGIREAAAACLRLVVDARLPQDLEDQLNDAYSEMVAITGVAAAVRSSAIAEDGAGSSFAGLYESFLNVRGLPEVLAAVRGCYASLWSERAIRYRATRQSANDAMALVVMGLVPSEASGIAFTAHPVTGERDRVLINASWGLGEAIVSGVVTPDAFVVAKEPFAIVEREIAEKTLAIFPHPDGGGTIERQLAGGDALKASITDAEALAVAELAIAVERHWGTPQDIEWGIYRGDLFLLQSRPITTL